MRRTPQIRWGSTDGERISFLRTHYPTMTLRALTAAFNRKFALAVTEAAVGYQLHAHQILRTAKTEPPQTKPE